MIDTCILAYTVDSSLAQLKLSMPGFYDMLQIWPNASCLRQLKDHKYLRFRLTAAKNWSIGPLFLFVSVFFIFPRSLVLKKWENPNPAMVNGSYMYCVGRLVKKQYSVATSLPEVGRFQRRGAKKKNIVFGEKGGSRPPEPPPRVRP